MEEVADRFNHFFVNVGPDLESKIMDPGVEGKHMGDLVNKSPCSMLLERVEEKEILDIVKNCKNKQSTDF